MRRTALLVLALAIAPRARADEQRSDCRFVLTLAGGVQYGLLGLGGEYGCHRWAGYLAGGPFGATGGVRFFTGEGIGGFLSLGSGVLATDDDPGTNLYVILLDAIGGVRWRWGAFGIQLGIGAGVWGQLSSGPRSTVRTGLILNPDAQLGLSFFFG